MRERPGESQAVTSAPRTSSADKPAEFLATGPEYERNDLAFANSIVKPNDLTKVRNAFKALLKKAGIPEIKLYSLRHTHATLLLEAGEDIKTLWVYRERPDDRGPGTRNAAVAPPAERLAVSTKT